MKTLLPKVVFCKVIMFALYWTLSNTIKAYNNLCNFCYTIIFTKFNFCFYFTIIWHVRCINTNACTNSFIPPPVPVDSITGVLNLPDLPFCDYGWKWIYGRTTYDLYLILAYDIVVIKDIIKTINNNLILYSFLF